MSAQAAFQFMAPEDAKRLGQQQRKVERFMADGRWHRLSEISEATGAPEASVSARLRTMRARGFAVDRRSVGRGLHEYRAEART